MDFKHDRSTAVSQPARFGAAIVETAFVLPILLFMLFAFLDLGLAAIRQNALSDASRRIARQAIIHGALNPNNATQWGPEPFVGTAATDSPVVAAVKVAFPTMSIEDVEVHVSWPDGGNLPGDHVSVTVAYRHEVLVPGMLFWGTLDLASHTSMQIVN